MKYLSNSTFIKINDLNESSVAIVDQNGKLELVYTEERYNGFKYFNWYPIISLKKASEKIKDKVKTSCPDDEVLILKSFFPEMHISGIHYSHHLCHCYESFYTSGFDHAAILVADGYGENDKKGVESITFYHKIGKETKVLKKYYLPNSLGLFYKEAAKACGFKVNEEGHFMGLSAYGVPDEERYLKIENGKFIYNQKYYDIINHLGEKKVDKFSLSLINKINFAATIQRDLIECVMELVKDIKKLTNEDNLCLSGGIFNNVLANNYICESDIFKNIWCSPAPSDYGISVGKAYMEYEIDNKDIKYNRLDSAYLGEEYSDEKIIEYLNRIGIEFEEIGIDKIADLFVDNRVIVWFQGRSEYGKRALGHRSILCNPIDRSNYDKVSYMIKKRAEYRPLACTIPSELFDLMFDVKNKDLVEFMLRGIPIRKEMRDKVKACCANDNTTRPQNLNRNINMELYDVIMNFYKKTGIPCIVNTSLNGRGKPIIESIGDCIIFAVDHSLYIDDIVFNGKYRVRLSNLLKNYNKFRREL